MHQLPETTGTLNSWKEIASYMQRGIRTVQRWELEFRLPVHRIAASNRSPVFAYKAELDCWLQHRLRGQTGSLGVVAATPVESAPGLAAQVVQNHSNTLEKAAQLTSRMLRLLEKQQLHTRVLAKQVARMADLLPCRQRAQFVPALVAADRRTGEPDHRGPSPVAAETGKF